MIAAHHLLFGPLALQNGLTDKDQLVAAFQAWARDNSRSLADHLMALGYLSPAKRSVVEDSHADDPLSRQRFLIEAEVNGGLEHPGLVPVEYFGAAGFLRYSLSRGRDDSVAITRFQSDISDAEVRVVGRATASNIARVGRIDRSIGEPPCARRCRRTEARNAAVGSECRLDSFLADPSMRWWCGIMKG
jgi:hypothetical protein